MGDMAEDAMNEYYRYEAYLDHLDSQADAIIEDYKMGVAEWVDKSGTKTLVQNVSLSYIHNILKFLNAKDNKTSLAEAWIYIFECELKKRPKGNQLPTFI